MPRAPCARRLITDQRGATAVEYALVAALIAVAAAGAFIALGNEVQTSYGDIQSEVDAAND